MKHLRKNKREHIRHLYTLCFITSLIFGTCRKPAYVICPSPTRIQVSSSRPKTTSRCFNPAFIQTCDLQLGSLKDHWLEDKMTSPLHQISSPLNLLTSYNFLSHIDHSERQYIQKYNLSCICSSTKLLMEGYPN